ncbi:MAG: helix-turn-helix domain-containing protein [Clostridia bacterium]|nr:helix-turn-helix domain-containing protein [Clostridia bacterium]
MNNRETKFMDASVSEPAVYTINDIKDILQVSRPTVDKLIKQHEFPCFLWCGKYRIPKKGFDEWLRRKGAGMR